MGGTDKKNRPPKKVRGQSDKSAPAPTTRDDAQQDDPQQGDPLQDDVEDGDIATPKRDLDGDDDQPL